MGEGAEDGGAAGAVVLVDVVDGAGSGAAPGAGAAVGGVHRPGAARVRLISGESKTAGGKEGDD